MKKATFTAKLLAAATLGFSVFTLAPAANATSLVPTTEGEIQTNLGCSDSAQCIDTTNPAQSPFTYSVTSLGYDTDGLNPEFGPSRLFVDNRSTENSYGLGISFGTTDAGTNPSGGEFWLRPVAMLANGLTFENGQLEVGKFSFDFLGKTVASVTLDLFDIEDVGFTQVLSVNGETSQAIVPTVIGNGSRQKVTFYNVNSFELQLGKPGPNSVFSNTGDGVAVGITVPEPGTVVSLGVLAVAGMFGLRKGKKALRAN